MFEEVGSSVPGNTVLQVSSVCSGIQCHGEHGGPKHLKMNMEDQGTPAAFYAWTPGVSETRHLTPLSVHECCFSLVACASCKN